MLLVLVVIAGAAAAAFTAEPQLSSLLGSKPKDFSLSASPTALVVGQGSSGRIVVTVTSLNGLTGSLGLTAALSTNATDRIVATFDPIIISIEAGKTAGSTLIVTVKPDAPAGNYPIMVAVINGAESHTISVTVTVSSIPDFTIAANPSGLIVQQNNSNTTTIIVTSLDSFTGNVSLTINGPFGFLGFSGGASPLKLTPGGSNTTILAVYASSLTPVGSYTVSVTGSGGGLSRTVLISVLVRVAGCACGTEALSLDRYAFSSSTNVSLYLRNTGTSNVTLLTYYVKDSSGDQYSNTAWAGPSIPTSSLRVAVFLIGSSCSNCTLSGYPFTFTFGYSYTITVVTSRNSVFTFTVVR